MYDPTLTSQTAYVAHIWYLMLGVWKKINDVTREKSHHSIQLTYMLLPSFNFFQWAWLGILEKHLTGVLHLVNTDYSVRVFLDLFQVHTHISQLFTTDRKLKRVRDGKLRGGTRIKKVCIIEVIYWLLQIIRS